MREARNDTIAKGPFSQISLDITAVKSQQRMSVGALTVRNGDRMVFCTTFLISSTRALTNHHCIEREAGSSPLANAEDMTLYFKNPGEREETTFAVRRIIDYERTDAETNILESRDWALLELDRAADAFAPLEVLSQLPGIETFSTDMQLSIWRFDPPDFDNNGKVAVFAEEPATLPSSRYFSGPVRTSLTLEAREVCREGKARFSAEYAACEEVTVTDQQVYELIETNLSEKLTQTRIRQGNSGSPVIFEGAVFGITHSGVFQQGSNPTTDLADGAVMQYLYYEKDRL